MSNSLVSESILKTVAYFDIFSFPLTLWEIWQWLQSSQKVSLDTVGVELPKLINSGRVQYKNGFYFLPGRQANIENRLTGYQIAEDKFKKCCRISRIFARFPFIRMIAVCNTLAYSNSSRKADLDFFVIVKPGRLWFVRMLTAGLMHFMNLRPRKGEEQDKICLSFFVSENRMNLSTLMIEDDIYLKYWVNQLVPLYMEHKSFINFVNSNMWLRKSLVNFLTYRVNRRRRVALGRWGKWLKALVENFLGGRRGDFLERKSKEVQLARLPRVLKEQMNKSTSVVVNDDVLKFHDQDRRANYRYQYNEKIRDLGLSQ